MEYVRDGSLKLLLKGKKMLKDEEASIVMKCILSAVEHVHSKNYVHRDLKPENILINDFSDLSSIKLVDFGLSTSFKIN